MKQYLCTGRRSQRTAIVAAADYDGAAREFARTLNGARVVARRVTGDAGNSGLFQGYRVERGTGHLNSVGEQFHVSERGAR